MKYRLLCADLDGTLLDGQKKLTQGNRQAVREAYRQGMEICIASGRPACSAADILDELGVEGSVVALGGSMVVSHGKEIRRDVLGRKAVLGVLDIARRTGVHTIFNDETASVVVNGYTELQKRGLASGVMTAKNCRLETCESMARIVDSGAIEVLKISIQESCQEKLEEVRRLIQREVDVSVAKSDVDYLDVFPKGQSKWTGIQSLLDFLGIPAKECAAFGDNENDLEMITNAGLGIAMENGEAGVKAAADHITRGHDEDGVAYGIRTWVLGCG